MSRLIGSVSCGLDEVVALFVRDQIADMADCLPKLIVYSRCFFSDQSLELRECHLCGIEVGAIRWEEQEPRADI